MNSHVTQVKQNKSHFWKWKQISLPLSLSSVHFFNAFEYTGFLCKNLIDTLVLAPKIFFNTCECSGFVTIVSTNLIAALILRSVCQTYLLIRTWKSLLLSLLFQIKILGLLNLFLLSIALDFLMQFLFLTYLNSQ